MRKAKITWLIALGIAALSLGVGSLASAEDDGSVGDVGGIVDELDAGAVGVNEAQTLTGTGDFNGIGTDLVEPQGENQTDGDQ